MQGKSKKPKKEKKQAGKKRIIETDSSPDQGPVNQTNENFNIPPIQEIVMQDTVNTQNQEMQIDINENQLQQQQEIEESSNKAVYQQCQEMEIEQVQYNVLEQKTEAENNVVKEDSFKEYDIVFQPNKKKLTFLHFPLRPNYRPYKDLGEIKQVNRREDMLELQYTLQKNENFDKDQAEFKVENFSFKSRLVEQDQRYMVGYIKFGKLYMHPINEFLQMRPNFSYISEQQKQEVTSQLQISSTENEEILERIFLDEEESESRNIQEHLN